MSGLDSIEHEVDDGRARITLNRSKKLNAHWREKTTCAAIRCPAWAPRTSPFMLEEVQGLQFSMARMILFTSTSSSSSSSWPMSRACIVSRRIGRSRLNDSRTSSWCRK